MGIGGSEKKLGHKKYRKMGEILTVKEVLNIAKFRKKFLNKQFIFYKQTRNSYFYIEKWIFKVMCEVFYRAKRDMKEAT